VYEKGEGRGDIRKMPYKEKIIRIRFLENIMDIWGDWMELGMSVDKIQ
jgi:hypothetical protein